MGKISIVVPVYNVEDKLEKCLDSLINQTYKNIEIILVNDGSKDKSGDICDKYAEIDERIKVIHQGNKGVSKSRNEGIRNSTGEVIQFVDSDDWIELNCCEECYDEYSKNKSNLIMWGYTNYTSESNKVDCIFNKDEEVSSLEKSEFIYIKYNDLFNSPCNKLFSLSIIKENKIFFKEELSLGEDLLFNLDYIFNMKSDGKLIMINKCYYNYYDVSENSLSKSVKDDYINSREVIYNRLFEVLQKYSDLNDDVMKKYYTLRKRGMQKIIISISNDDNISFSQKYKKIKSIMRTKDYDQCVNNSEYGSLAFVKKTISKLKMPTISILLNR